MIVESEKEPRAKQLISDLQSVAVAFSGGADSTLLLALCIDVLGRERVLAVTADSPTLPRSELAETRALASELGARHHVLATREMEDERFASNPPDRCFYCKQELFREIRALADDMGFQQLVYGATAGDLTDHRPGMRAAAEAGAVAPLLEAGFTKGDVRAVSRTLGLRTWDKPAMACLSSRIPYGTQLTDQNLTRVEQAEELLRRQMGFRQVRVRDHGTVARIELEPDGFGLLLNDPDRELIVAELKGLGYRYVALDLEGFRSGSMNEGADTAPSRLAVADIPDYHQSVSSNRRETDSSLESR